MKAANKLQRSQCMINCSAYIESKYFITFMNVARSVYFLALVGHFIRRFCIDFVCVYVGGIHHRSVLVYIQDNNRP